MTKKTYLVLHESLCAKMIAITKAKNEDYTGKGDDPFANFSNVKSCGGATPEQGFLLRMNDKMMRISSFVEKGTLQVKDESVEDTLLDLANYSLLMIGYLKAQRKIEDCRIADRKMAEDSMRGKEPSFVNVGGPRR